MLNWNFLYKIIAIQKKSKKIDFKLLLDLSFPINQTKVLRFPINQIKVLRFQQEDENFKMLT
jgi:hypothetical protein